MADVFISHVEEDGGLAIDMVKAIEVADISTWHYERDNLPGLTYLQQITEAIDACSVVVVLVSNASLGSHQVAKEIEYAHDNGKKFLPVLVDLTQAEFMKRRKDWHLMFGAATSIRLGDHHHVALTRIVRGLQALIRELQPSLVPSSSKSEPSNTAPMPPRAGLPKPVKAPSQPVTRGAVEPPTPSPGPATVEAFCRRAISLHQIIGAIGAGLIVLGSSFWGVDAAFTAYENQHSILLQDTSKIGGVLFSHDGTLVLSEPASGLMAWNAVTGERITNEDFSKTAVLDYDSRGTYYGIKNHDGKFFAFAVAGGKYKETALSDVTDVPIHAGFTADHKNLIQSFANGTVGLWDVATGNKLSPSLTAQAVFAPKFAISKDTKKLGVFGYDDKVHLVNFSTFKEFAAIPVDATAVSMSPDGERILVVERGGGATVWNGSTGLKMFCLPTKKITGGAWYSHDGERIIAGLNNGTVTIYGGQDGTLLKTVGRWWKLGAPKVTDVSISDDNGRVVVAWRDGTVRIFNMANM